MKQLLIKIWCISSVVHKMRLCTFNSISVILWQSV